MSFPGKYWISVVKNMDVIVKREKKTNNRGQVSNIIPSREKSKKIGKKHRMVKEA